MKTQLIRKILVSGLLVIVCGGSIAWADGIRKTNISIDSSELGPVSINDKVKTKQEKQAFKLDDNVALGFNDDGNPNVGMRF